MTRSAVPAPEARRVSRPSEPEEVAARRAEASVTAPAPPAFGARIGAPGGAAGTGVPLPAPTRAYFERRLGGDLSRVRLHDSAGAAGLAVSLGAKAVTLGTDIYFAPGRLAPATLAGQRLLAHELTHSLQSQERGLARLDPDGSRVAPTQTPEQRLSGLLTSLGDQAIPSFQASLDNLDEGGVRTAGRHALLLWHLIEAQRQAMAPRASAVPTPQPSTAPAPSPAPAPPPAPALSEDIALDYDRRQRALLDAIGTRRYRGQAVAGAAPAPSLDQIPDTGLYVWEQTESSAWVAKDTAALRALLVRETLSEADEWTAVGLMRQHQNPTHFAFMQGVMGREGLTGRIGRFRPGPRDAADMLRSAQPGVIASLARDTLGEPGDLVLLPSEGRVRLILPATPREVAAELYGAEERWQDVLRPYNRGALAGSNGSGWLPAGTELLVDPLAMTPRYRGIFAAAPEARRQAQQRGSDPYLWLRPEANLVVGNSVTVGVSWPNSLFGPQRLQWWVDNDSVAVREQGLAARLDLGEGTLEMGPGRRTAIELRAAAPGNHVVHCRLTNSEGQTQELSRTLVVLTLAERTALVDLYAPAPLSRPRELLTELRAERDRLPPGSREERTRLDQRIAAVQRAIDEADAEARTYRGPGSQALFTPLRAVYVSAEDQPMTVALRVYVDRDPGYFDSTDVHLKLWDFTLEENIRHYTASGRTYADALRTLLRDFADDAPYPTGNIRFLNVDFTPVGPYYRPPESHTFPTDGGTRWAAALRALSMGALAVGVVGAAALQPEVAVPAFVISGLLAGAGGVASLYDRLAHGDFEWDVQAGMDILDIAAALLTLGVAGGVTTAVQGAGRMTVTGTLQLRIGQAQLAIMAGVHVAQINAALQSGDQDRVSQAVLRALADGALVLIVHRAGRRIAEPEGPRPEVPSARRTVAGTGGAGPERPPGTPEPTPRTPHQEAMEATLRSRMGVRPPPLPRPGATPVPEGTFRRDIATLAEARQVYDEARARTPGREVGIWINRHTGRYAVTVGGTGGVDSPPGAFGEWAGVQHFHPNEGNILTYRNPAPQDLDNALVAAAMEGRPHTEMIEHDLPTGGRTYTAYTANPDGSLTIEYQRPDGSRYQRSYASLQEYSADWGSRTRAVVPDPNNPEYRDLMRDIEDYYASRSPGGGRSMAGSASRPRPTGREAEQAARAESLAWWRSPGVTTETRFARHDQTFRSIAATLRNLAARRASPIGVPNERVLDMPVDEFIRRNRTLAAELAAIERDAAGNPTLREELNAFLEGRLEAGAREVGARRPDLVEFFLDRGEVIVTDFTVNTSRVHRLKTAFYREVMAALLGRRGPRVSSLDINLQTGESDVRP